MGQALRAEHPDTDREPPRRRPQPRDPAAGFERRAVPLTARELLPMAAILVLISAVAAVTIIYLTAFGRLTAQGSRDAQLDRQISQLQTFNAGLAGEVARLQTRDRVEREARRLGLQPFAAEETHRMELPAGSFEIGQAPPDRAAGEGPPQAGQ